MLDSYYQALPMPIYIDWEILYFRPDRFRLKATFTIENNLRIVKDYLMQSFPLSITRLELMDKNHTSDLESSVFVSAFLQESLDVQINDLTMEELINSIALHKIRWEIRNQEIRDKVQHANIKDVNVYMIMWMQTQSLILWVRWNKVHLRVYYCK